MNKKTLTRVLFGLIAITIVATVIAYFVIKPDRPWMAFYVACCGGVLVFNFLTVSYTHLTLPTTPYV